MHGDDTSSAASDDGARTGGDAPLPALAALPAFGVLLLDTMAVVPRRIVNRSGCAIALTAMLGCCWYVLHDRSFTIRLVSFAFVPAGDTAGRFGPAPYPDEDWLVVEIESDLSLLWLASFRLVQFRCTADGFSGDEQLFGRIRVNGRDLREAARDDVRQEDPRRYQAWVRLDIAMEQVLDRRGRGREFLRLQALAALRCRVVGVQMVGGFHVSNVLTIPAADLRRAVDEALAR